MAETKSEAMAEFILEPVAGFARKSAARATRRPISRSATARHPVKRAVRGRSETTRDR